MTFSPCPQCQFHKISTRNRGKKAGGALGILAGAASGATGALKSVQTAEDLSGELPPAGALLSLIAGAVLGAIFGGTLGCEVGATLGEAVDNTLLDNYRCLSCGHTFSPETVQTAPVPSGYRDGPDPDPDYRDHPLR